MIIMNASILSMNQLLGVAMNVNIWAYADHDMTASDNIPITIPMNPSTFTACSSGERIIWSGFVWLCFMHPSGSVVLAHFDASSDWFPIVIITGLDAPLDELKNCVVPVDTSVALCITLAAGPDSDHR